jgi:hypothetical protein
VAQTYDFESRDEQQAVRRAELSDAPVPQEQARRVGFANVKGAASSTAARGRDVLYPLILITRGLRRGFRWCYAWWRRTDKDRRRMVLAAIALVTIVIAMLPRGPWILAGALMASAALAGRAPRAAKETPQQLAKLQAIYNGLVPYLMDEYDPDQVFTPGGEFSKAFDGWIFDEFGQLIKLDLHYSPYFKDGEPEARAKVEHAIERKTGLNNDYMYEWDEEGNKLSVAIMPGTGGGGGPVAEPLEMVEAPTGRVRPPAP